MTNRGVPVLTLCLLGASLAACTSESGPIDITGGQSGDDFVGDPSRGCPEVREPIDDLAPLDLQDDADPLRELSGVYPMEGAWAPSSIAPEWQLAEGELTGAFEVGRNGESLQWQKSNCLHEAGVVVPVTVRLQLDGSDAELTTEGEVLLQPDERTGWNARLTAIFEQPSLARLTPPDGVEWQLPELRLDATLTARGSSGRLWGAAETSEAAQQAQGDDTAVGSGSPETLATWPSGVSGCGEDTSGLTLRSDAEDPALLRTIDGLSRTEQLARLVDGTELAVELGMRALSSECPASVPVALSVRSDDGSVDLEIELSVEQHADFPPAASFDTNVGWAVPPAEFEARYGSVPVDLSEFAHVGIDARINFADSESVHVQVLGYTSGECGACGEDGCIECQWDGGEVLFELVEDEL